MNLENPFEGFLGILDQKDVFVHAGFQVSFSDDFGSGSGCLGLENLAFGKGGIGNINFRRSCPFFIILNVLGTSFHDFRCLVDWFEIRRLFRVILGHPRS